MGKARIFLHHSSMPYTDATPAAPVSTQSITTTHEGASAEAITAEEVHTLQETWGNAIKDISAAYLENGDYMAVANDAAGALYGYGHSNVLFKPTKASEHPFRPTATGALSYFVPPIVFHFTFMICL